MKWRYSGTTRMSCVYCTVLNYTNMYCIELHTCAVWKGYTAAPHKWAGLCVLTVLNCTHMYCIDLHKCVLYWTTYMCCMKCLYSWTTQMGCVYSLCWITRICTVLNYSNVYCIELHTYAVWNGYTAELRKWAVCIHCIELHAYVLYWSTQICTVLNYIHVLYERAIQLNYTNGLCVLTVTNYTHMYCIELLKHRYMHCTILNYGVATISKLLQNIRLCCRI